MNKKEIKELLAGVAGALDEIEVHGRRNLLLLAACINDMEKAKKMLEEKGNGVQSG